MKKKLIGTTLCLSLAMLLSSLNVDNRIVKADNLSPTVHEELMYIEDFEYMEGYDGQDIYQESGKVWLADDVYGEVNEEEQLELLVQSVDNGGYSRIGAFGTTATENLSDLVPEFKYTFSVKIDVSDMSDGSVVYFEYLNKEWTGVTISNTGLVTILGNAFNGSYQNGVLSFDFIAQGVGTPEGDNAYPYIKMTGKDLQIGDKVLLDDLKIVRNRKEYAYENNFEGISVGENIKESYNFYFGNMNTVTVAQNENNKYAKLSKSGSEGVQQWAEYYLNRLPILDNHLYRLEFDVIEDEGWDEFYIRYNDNVSGSICYTFKKDGTVDLYDYEYFKGATFDGHHVTYDFIPSSTINANWWNQIMFVVRNTGSISFTMDNIKIYELNKETNATLSIEDAIVTLNALYIDTSISAAIVYGEDDVRHLMADEVVLDNTAYDVTKIGEYTVPAYVVDENGTKYETTFKMTVEDGIKMINVTGIKDTYKYGEAFNTADIEINLEMESGSNQEVEFSVEHLKDFDSTILGEQIITIEYDDFEYTAEIEIVDYVADLALTNSKTTYNQNEQFDASSLTVNKIMASGEQSAINNSQLTISGFDSSTVGTKIITVAYQGVEKTFEIEVVANENPQTSEQPSVQPSVEPTSEKASAPAEETSKQEGENKKGCKGEAATSLFGLISLAGILLFKKRK